MVGTNKVVSWVVLACFLFNTVISDLAFGQVLNYRSNADKLAAPSQLTDIVGIQHKDMGRIKLALEEQLVTFVHPEHLIISLSTFQTILKEQTFKEKTIFRPADMQFFFSETKLTSAGLCVMVRLKDRHGLRTYYATFSLQKDEAGGFPINVYTEEQYKATIGSIKGLPRIKAEDAKAIERYVQHERGIDTVIRYAHEHGLAKEPIPARFDYGRSVERILNENGIKVTNPKGLIPIEGRKFFLVKLTEKIQGMISANLAVVIDADGVEHTVPYYAHSSNNATHVFVKEGAFEALTNPKYVIVDPKHNAPYQSALANIMDTLSYEAGVPLGFPVTVDSTGKLWNELNKRSAAADSERREFQSNPLEAAIVNLDHVKGRDYADGQIKAAAAPTYVYFFGDGKTSAEELFKGDLDNRKIILGGKGEGLHSMTRAKISVPPGFTITTDACNYYSANGQKWPAGLEAEVNSNLAGMEKLLNKKLGDSKDPLLVSVRSGAKFSMPGMMDTILNLGLNDDTVLVFANKTGNERLAWDSYRRLIQMFSDVVLGIEKKDFEKIIESKKEELGVKQDVELDAQALKDLVARFKALVENRGKAFPQDVRQQLTMAVNAVFESWNNPRAITYRKLNKIPNDLGTAVNVQAMVFGNTGNKSGTGVGFTRNPSTGVKEPFGDFLINAQGEDVVAGTRTPQPVSQLREVMPEVYEQLIKITDGLEKHYKDIQDFEFTIEDGKLYLLQTRSGKRTGVAAVKAAVDMVKEGLITQEEALMRVDPKQLNEVLFPILDPQAKKSLTPKDILATGLSAGPGAATGQIVFTSEDAVEWTNKGKQVILWRKETCPDDIAGMDKAIGVGTSIGGMASHAALVARGMGKVTMVGAGLVDVSYEKKEAYIKDESGQVIHTLKEGDWVTLNVVEKEKAQLIIGKKNIVRPEAIGGELGEFLSWAKEASRLRVWANAEIPNDAKKAFSFGAEGIGLCRTEHMFFGEDRLPIMQEMILADTDEARQAALDKLLPMQREDFMGLFKEMKGYPVTIRTLDPPLHEFLPKREELMVEIKELEMTFDNLKRPHANLKYPYISTEENKVSGLIIEKKKLLSRINELHEFNPMMGMRGTRLGIMMPEITAMQARAIAEATVVVIKEGGDVVPEIMIPLVGKLEEFTHQKKIVVDVVEKVMRESGVSFKYHIGTMIEVPRGALTADELATEAEFFSFGTNDLTQYGAGFSRDDIGKFMAHYLSLGIYPVDPFETFDAKGIGELVRIAVEKGRKTNPNLKIGICGEHGGDPESIKFFHEAGLNYVSCSPYRVLGAWLAAAQATIRERLSKNTEQIVEAAKFAPTKGNVGANSSGIVSEINAASTDIKKMAVIRERISSPSDLEKIDFITLNAIREVIEEGLKKLEGRTSFASLPAAKERLKWIRAAIKKIEKTLAITAAKTQEERTYLLGREPSQYGPHPSQESLRPLFERVVWARKNAPGDFKIKSIYAFKDQKHGMEPKDAISFGIVLENHKVIITDAPVMGGISAGGLEPRTHASIKEAIKFFNDNVASKFIGLNIARPDEITDKIVEIDEEFRNAADDKTLPRFSYIGAEIAVGISMVSTIALAEALHVPVEVVINYRYNEYAISHGLAKELRPMSIPVNYSVVWEGGKHGVAKYLHELVKEGIIKDDTRFPARFKDEGLIKDKDILLAMVPPQELQIIVFAPDWKEAERIGVKLTKQYQGLLKTNGIKTKYGAESGFTTEQVRAADGRLITTELVLDILEQATDSLALDEAKYVRYADDLAASEMYIPEIDMYYVGPAAAATIPGISEQSKNDGLVTNAEFTQYKLARYKNHPRFISCEDWAYEGKIEHWQDAKQIMSSMVQMGDDNNVSRADLILKFKDVQNAHLHKPNQVSEEQASMESVATSHSLGNVVVWSHRGTRSPQEKYTAWGAIGTGSFGGKWTLLGPGRSALIAAMTQADAMYREAYGVNIPYQGELVLDPNGPYKDYGFAKRVREEIAAAETKARSSEADTSPLTGAQEERDIKKIRDAAHNLALLLEYMSRTGRKIRVSGGDITVDFEGEVPSEEHGLFKGLTQDMMKPNAIGDYITDKISEHKGTMNWVETIPGNSSVKEIENVFLKASGGKVQSSEAGSGGSVFEIKTAHTNIEEIRKIIELITSPNSLKDIRPDYLKKLEWILETGLKSSETELSKDELTSAKERLKWLKEAIEKIEPAGNGVSDEIAAMASLASEAGVPMSMERYNLLVTWEFFAKGELKEHKAKYGDRFDLDMVGGTSAEEITDNIMAKAAGKEARTIALIPSDLPVKYLKLLTKVGIRFMRVNVTDLLQAKVNNDPGREKFQVDTYIMMLLLRQIDGSATSDSLIYRLLSFYLKSHFELTDKIAVEDYITAVVNDDVAKLIKGYLSYRRAQPYEVPDYHNIAASLISA